MENLAVPSMNQIKNICVFCGASTGTEPVYEAAAQALGHFLATCQISLVYGGGNIGLMGAVARAAIEYGGRVIGVIPSALMRKEIVDESIGELILVNTMHERKAKMAQLADAFIALPGGFGTLDELFEMLTWNQLGIHGKPIGLLNVNNFYTPLLQWITHAQTQGFIRLQHVKLLTVAQEPSVLLDQLRHYEALPGLVQWQNLNGEKII